MSKILLIIFSLFVCWFSGAQMLLNPDENILNDTTAEDPLLNWNLSIKNCYSSGVYDLDDLKSGTYLLDGVIKIEGSKKWGVTPWIELEAQYKNYLENESTTDISLKSGGVKLSKGPVDLKLGLTTIAWGRADGYNPTDFFTPINITSRTLEPEDSRTPNLLADFTYYFSLWSIEVVFLPFTSSSTLFVTPELLSTVKLSDSVKPETPKSGIKFNFEPGSWDGSFSVVYGPDNKPVMDIQGVFPSLTIEPYSPTVLKVGFDYSTDLVGLGLRGEGGWRFYMEDKDETPLNDGEIILGIDSSIGNLSWNLGHNLHITPDAKEAEGFNFTPIIYDQERVFSNSTILRLSYTFLYEALRLELLEKYNWNSQESLTAVFLTWDAPDGNNFRIGGRKIFGPDDTLYAMGEETLSWALIEWEVSY